MAFVINKQSKRYGKIKTLYYLVESYREDNNVKRRTLLPLGECKSLREFLDFTERQEAMALGMIEHDEERLAAVHHWEKSSVLRIISIRKKVLQKAQVNKEKAMKLSSLYNFQ